MSIKTGAGLAEYAIKHIGDCYWWGTFGQVADQTLLDYKRSQYPDVYNSALYKDAEKQFGKTVFDCVGLVKGYLFEGEKYNPSRDVNVSGLYVACSQTGTISTLPEIPGVCVFHASLDHVGVYIGNGEVVEAAGHLTGVVRNKIINRPSFTLWGKPKWFEYDIPQVSFDHTSEPFENLSQVDKNSILKLPVLSFGSTGVYVKIMEVLLGIKPSGVFDSNVKKKVIEYQCNNHLEIDGICGKNTWTKLIG